MTTFENLSVSEKLRSAIHRDVRAVCVEICHCMGLDITRPANAIIAELVISKIALYASDLEAFAKHAKRTTINTDDVKLLVRRNPSLKERLNKIVSDPPSKEKRRKTTLPILKTDTPPQKKLLLSVEPKKKVPEEKTNERVKNFEDDVNVKERLNKIVSDPPSKEKRRKTTLPILKTDTPPQKKLLLSVEPKKKVPEEKTNERVKNFEDDVNVVDLTLSQ